ncbi:hypothetical protein F511_20083 [Dorcoceras hygrometricum]|uniref:Uncharacterized protein n=1 Tax=Dorcoceras hygrometricum TaxID=472368 RepID=A0A2Z7BP97_9LAMI|nr:hypothetical protein F511_20083 [Dorcoceras hygrometricum]
MRRECRASAEQKTEKCTTHSGARRKFSHFVTAGVQAGSVLSLGHLQYDVITVFDLVVSVLVNFEFLLAMENSDIVSMFKTLETIGFKGFLTATGSVYEAAVDSNTIEKETNINAEAIIVRSDPEQPAQQTITYIGQGIFAAIQIREINWATHFLPKISPEEKGKGVLEVVSRPNPVEEHCRLVRNSAWEAVSNIMEKFDEWITSALRTKQRQEQYGVDQAKIPIKKKQFDIQKPDRETSKVRGNLANRNLECMKSRTTYSTIHDEDGLHITHFHEMSTIYLRDLKIMIDDFEGDIGSEEANMEKIKLIILYYVRCIGSLEDKIKNEEVDPQWMRLVDDLDRFCTNPWCRLAYKETVFAIRKDLGGKFEDFKKLVKTRKRNPMFSGFAESTSVGLLSHFRSWHMKYSMMLVRILQLL